nr:MAG TPA: hypothetical protein [Caudoviricetes sp.]
MITILERNCKLTNPDRRLFYSMGCRINDN